MSVSLQSAVRRARQRLIEAQEEVRRLELQVQGLEDAIRDYVDSPSEIDGGSDGRMSRTDAILKVMEQNRTDATSAKGLAGPVGALRGTPEKAKDVGAALAYLKSQHKVWSPGRDRWLLSGVSDPEAPIEPPDDDVPF